MKAQLEGNAQTKTTGKSGNRDNEDFTFFFYHENVIKVKCSNEAIFFSRT